MLSTNLSLSSILMHRVARSPAAGARGPAGGVYRAFGGLIGGHKGTNRISGAQGSKGTSYWAPIGLLLGSY